MTANKAYFPAFQKGTIKALQMKIFNPGLTEITALSENGIYYSFQGNDFQLLSCKGVKISAGSTEIITVQLPTEWEPNSDIKIMVDTGGLIACQIDCLIAWEY